MILLQYRHKSHHGLCKSNAFKYVLQEEVALENQEKIKVEKQTVHEEKKELDKHQEMAEDINDRYSSVRKRIDQLSGKMEQLKVKYHIAASLFSETKNSFRNQ